MILKVKFPLIEFIQLITTEKPSYLSNLSIYIKMSSNFCVSRAFEKGNPHRGG